MSLATRCTHCGTIFKVVQGQLKVSEGWVRCGRCHEVFNALPALFDLDTEAPPPRQVPAVPSPAQPFAPPPQAPQVQQGPSTPPPAQAPARPMASPPASTPTPPPSWSRTQPSGLTPPPAAVRAPSSPAPTPLSAHTQLTSAGLAFGAPAASAPAARPAATDFDLDTSVDLSDPTPLPSSAANHLRIADEPRPWLEDPPEDVPSTDEADALESRYLLPSRDSVRPVRRRPGPVPRPPADVVAACSRPGSDGSGSARGRTQPACRGRQSWRREPGDRPGLGNPAAAPPRPGLRARTGRAASQSAQGPLRHARPRPGLAGPRIRAPRPTQGLLAPARGAGRDGAARPAAHPWFGGATRPPLPRLGRRAPPVHAPAAQRLVRAGGLPDQAAHAPRCPAGRQRHARAHGLRRPQPLPPDRGRQQPLKRRAGLASHRPDPHRRPRRRDRPPRLRAA